MLGETVKDLIFYSQFATSPYTERFKLRKLYMISVNRHKNYDGMYYYG